MENSASKKILYFTISLKFFISHRLPLALEALKNGYEVHLISPHDIEVGEMTKLGINFHPISISRSKANPFQEISTISQVYKIYKKIGPDIVHHITIKPVLYGTLAARMAGLKAIVNAFSGLGYVFTAKGVKAAIIKTIIKLAYRLILRHKNLISIIQNHNDLDYLQAKSIIRPDQTVLIKGSGVDLEKFTATEEPGGTPAIILPARLLKDKGVVEFVEAAKILTEQKINVRMALVGDIDAGNPSSITNEELSEWVNREFIEHWGFSRNMPETIKNCNIVCLPSYREGMPKSLIEATACGRAIITTDVPGCREMIDAKNPNGLLVPPKNSTAIAEAIKTLISDPARRHEMACNGRTMAEREFSIELVVQKTLDIYQKLLD